MALVKKRSQSSRLVVIGVVVVVVAGIGYFLLQQFYLNPSLTNTPGTGIDRTSQVIQNFGEDILQDPRYRALQPYGTEPVPPGDTNPNPFQ